MEDNTRFENEYSEINKLYDECISYLKNVKVSNKLKMDLLEQNQQENLNEIMNEENEKQVSDTEENADDYLENYIETENKRNTFERSEAFIYKKSKTELKFENEIDLKNIQIDKKDIVEAVNHRKTENVYLKLNQNEEKSIINSKIEPIPKINTSKSTKSIQNDTKNHIIKLEVLKSDQSNIQLLSSDEESLLSDKENKTLYSRLRRLSHQLPKIIITKSNSSLNSDQTEIMKNERSYRKLPTYTNKIYISKIVDKRPRKSVDIIRNPLHRLKAGYGDYPRRLVSKNGIENVALISNVPYERLRMLNDTFHTLINLRWRWIVSGTIVVHFLIWLVFAVFWYITALAHYDFEPDPPKRACVTGGKDFVTIFLASVEAQTTIGFGDRTIDEECPESIFLFIMQLILGTGLSGVLTCVVYAKLTRPEKLSRDGVGFSKKAVISIRDGQLCLMIRAWDLNYDHIISSDFSAHFIKTHRTKEGEVIRYYARTLDLQQKQFLIWPVTLVHIIDETSPLYYMTPQNFAEYSYEITVSLKGASASMGTFTQSQTSYLPKEIIWGHKFPAVVKYDRRKQKYAIEHKKLDVIEAVDTPLCSASQMNFSGQGKSTPPLRPCTPGSFSEKMESFHLERQSSFRKSK